VPWRPSTRPAPTSGSPTSSTLTLAGAVVTYLHYRRDEADAPPDRLLRAADAEFKGNPPPRVEAWLQDAG
jgi:hypothetical protein